MRQVHEEGEAVVSDGPREKCEADVARLHAHGLWATMEHDVVSPTMARGSAQGPTTRSSCRSRRRSSALLARAPRRAARRVRGARATTPRAARLFPQPYLDPTAEEAEASGQALVHPDLLRQRLDALELVTASLGARDGEQGHGARSRSAPDDVQAWLGVLNDTRLVLGTRLGVTEDEPDIDPDAPEARASPSTTGSPGCRATSSRCCCEIALARLRCGKVAP